MEEPKHKNLNTASELVGKTIKVATYLGYENFDDEDVLHLVMTDNTEYNIIASYGGFTGNSLDEYPSFIYVTVPNAQKALIKAEGK